LNFLFSQIITKLRFIFIFFSFITYLQIVKTRFCCFTVSCTKRKKIK